MVALAIQIGGNALNKVFAEACFARWLKQRQAVDVFIFVVDHGVSFNIRMRRQPDQLSLRPFGIERLPDGRGPPRNCCRGAEFR
jgi:hypothetical protein